MCELHELRRSVTQREADARVAAFGEAFVIDRGLHAGGARARRTHFRSAGQTRRSAPAGFPGLLLRGGGGQRLRGHRHFGHRRQHPADGARHPRRGRIRGEERAGHENHVAAGCRGLFLGILRHGLHRRRHPAGARRPGALPARRRESPPGAASRLPRQTRQGAVDPDVRETRPGDTPVGGRRTRRDFVPAGRRRIGAGPRAEHRQHQQPLQGSRFPRGNSSTAGARRGLRTTAPSVWDMSPERSANTPRCSESR